MEIRFVKIIEEGERKYQVTSTKDIPLYKDCPKIYREGDNVIYTDDSNPQIVYYIGYHGKGRFRIGDIFDVREYRKIQPILQAAIASYKRAKRIEGDIPWEGEIIFD